MGSAYVIFFQNIVSLTRAAASSVDKFQHSTCHYYRRVSTVRTVCTQCSDIVILCVYSATVYVSSVFSLHVSVSTSTSRAFGARHNVIMSHE